MPPAICQTLSCERFIATLPEFAGVNCLHPFLSLFFPVMDYIQSNLTDLQCWKDPSLQQQW